MKIDSLFVAEGVVTCAVVGARDELPKVAFERDPTVEYDLVPRTEPGALTDREVARSLVVLLSSLLNRPDQIGRSCVLIPRHEAVSARTLVATAQAHLSKEEGER